MSALFSLQMFDWPLLLAACIVGSATAAVGFALLERISAARGLSIRFWLCIGALTTGIGLWSSYLLGTVALRFPVVYGISVLGQLLVLVTAVGLTGAALSLTHAARTGRLPWFVVGIATSVASLLMYQTSIASLQLPGTWQPRPVPALIWVLAVSLISSAILRVISSRNSSQYGGNGLKLLACLAVGPLTVTSQMAGILFMSQLPPEAGTLPAQRADALLIAAPTVTGTLTILLLTTLMIAAERRVQEFFILSGERTSDLLITIDHKCIIYYANAKAARLLGQTIRDLTGQPAHLALPPELFETLRVPLQQVLTHSDTITVEAFHAQTQSWFEVGLYPWPDHIAIVLRDISKRKYLEQQIRHQALHDPLTGLANRVLFREEVERALEDPEGEPGQVAVLFLDLDDFKPINDSYGHTMGDELLVVMAQRLQQCVRPGDTVCRLGGDEFAVLIRQGGAGAAEQVADRILEALRHPFSLQELNLVVSTSIGIAVSDTGATNAEELLQHADMAMYSAKAQGLGSRQRFDAAMQQTVLDRFELKAELRRALANEELLLHYQPVVCLETGRIRCLEALVRWRHPARGQLSPAEFIPLAEESGLISALDDWVLENACRQVQHWQAC